MFVFGGSVLFGGFGEHELCISADDGQLLADLATDTVDPFVAEVEAAVERLDTLLDLLDADVPASARGGFGATSETEEVVVGGAVSVGIAGEDHSCAAFAAEDRAFESIDDAEQRGIPDSYPEEFRDSVRELLAHRLKEPTGNPELLIDPNDPECMRIVRDGFLLLAERRIAELEGQAGVA